MCLLCVVPYLDGEIAGIVVAVVVVVVTIAIILAVVIFRKWISTKRKRGTVITQPSVSPSFLISVRFPTHVGRRSSTPASSTEEGTQDLDELCETQGLAAKQEGDVVGLIKNDNKCENLYIMQLVCVLVLYVHQLFLVRIVHIPFTITPLPSSL